MAIQHVTAVIDVDDPTRVHEVVDSVLCQSRKIDEAIIDTTGLTVPASTTPEGGEVADTIATMLADADIPVVEAASEPEAWLWLIDNDTVAEPNALENLLSEVERNPSVVVAGAKQLNPTGLHNVGLWGTPTGDVLSLIEPGELDQGQYDHRSDMFAVSVQGMLIRSEVWESLDGVDDNAPQLARAADISWRARLAGHRVVVVPSAVVHRSDVHPASPDDSAAAATWLRLKHRGLLSMIGGWVWVLLAALGAFLWSLITKTPGEGWARARGMLRSATRPAAMAASRRQAKSTRTMPYAVVEELFAPRAEVRDFYRGQAPPEHEVIGDGTGTDGAEEPTGGHDDFTSLATPERTWVGAGAVAVVLILGGIGLIGWRHLLGVGQVTGGAMAPVADSLSDIFFSAVSGWTDQGLGSPGFGAPFSWVLVLFGLTGNASAALTTVIVAAMPLAGLTAWFALGELTSSRGARFGLALVWGAAPVLFVSSSDGRIGSVLVHILLPLLALALLRATGTSRPSTWTATAWVTILLALITASAPSLAIPLIGFVIVASIWHRRLWWTPALAITLFIPVIVTSWSNPRAMLADPGIPSGYVPAESWQQLLGFPQFITFDTGLGSLPWLDHLLPSVPWALIAVIVIALPLLFTAVVGALRSATARVGMVVALLGLITGYLAPLVPIAIDSNGVVATLFTGPAVSLIWAGLLVAAGAGTGQVFKRSPKFGVTTVSVMVITTMLASALWIIPRTVGTETLSAARNDAVVERVAAGSKNETLEPLVGFNALTPAEPTSLPALAQDQAKPPQSVATLVLESTSEGMNAELVTGGGTYLNNVNSVAATRGLEGPLWAPVSATPDAADEALRSLVGQIASGSEANPRPTLEDMGIGFVVLADPQGAQTTTAANIDSVTGLTPIGLTDPGWLWRVTPEDSEGAPVLGQDEATGSTIARARIESGGEVEALVPFTRGIDVEIPAGEDRTLVLADRADSGWHAELDGRALKTADHEWAQAFQIPDESGKLTMSYRGHSWYWLIPGAVLCLALLLGLPQPRRRTRASRTATPAEPVALAEPAKHTGQDGE